MRWNPRMTLSETHRAWLAVAFCLVLSPTEWAWSQPPPAVPAPPESITFADVVPRDRRWLVLLNNASNHLKANRTTEGLELLQRCFDAPEDAFVLRPEWDRPTSRGIAAKLLRDAGESVWKQYEVLFGPVARQALEQVETQGPPGAYQSVIRRYAHTLAGAAALDRLASWHLDRGDYEAAVNCWEQLLANPVHESRVTTLQRLKLILAARRCGRMELAAAQADLLGRSRVALGGQLLIANEWRTRLEQLPLPIPTSTAEWRLFGGVPERTRTSTGSTPFLLRPGVTLSMFDSEARPDLTAADHGAIREGRSQHERDLESAASMGTVMGFAGTPVINGDLILWRDAVGVRAVQQQTRQTVWTHSTSTRLHSLLVISGDSDMRSRQQGQSTYRQNSVLEQLASDGRHVYLVDDIHIPDRTQAQFMFDQGEPAPRADGTVPLAAWNRLVAIRLPSRPGASSVAWSLGGHPTQEASAVLPGHFFLGPPLPVGGLLYAVAEYQKQIWLIALRPETGRVEWRQTVSLAPQYSRETQLVQDKQRLSQACLPAAARGIIVCPLGSGILAGLNCITGEIAWAHDYRYRRKTSTIQYLPFGHNSTEQSNEGDFPNPPLIHNNRVYFLAPGDIVSDQVLCLDLQTGEKLWQVETTDLKYLATVNGDLVVGVGATDVIGLSAQKGTTTWTKRVPRISGVGATLPGLYLLPIADGRVLSLDLRDGSEVGFAMQAPGIRPGNLIVSGRDVLSLNGLDLQVFPQTADLLASLESRPQDQRNSDQFWHELGELQFRMGQVGPAKASLKKALTLADLAAQPNIRALLRELAWQEMLQQPDQRRQILGEYAALCELPEHRAQLLLLEGEEQVRAGELAQARGTAQTLLGLKINEPLRLLADPDRHLTAGVWAAELAKRVEAGAPVADPAHTAAGLHDFLSREDRQAMFAYLQQHPNTMHSADVRLALAKLLVQDGQAQAAELLVWRDHDGSDPAALAACRCLLELWESAGMYEDSGRLLHQIGTRLANVRGSDGLTGQEVYNQYPATRLAWSAARRFIPPDWPIDTLRITEQHDVDLKLRNTFNSIPRYLNIQRSTQQLAQRGQGLPNALQQIDSETGSVLAEITLPASGGQVAFPVWDSRNRPGHFLPLGGTSGCFGVSLLERGLVWNRGSTPQLRLNNIVRVGPNTAEVCVFRTRDRLLGLSPVTGQLLWERSDVEEVGRPNQYVQSALFGDSEAVVILESDSKAYRVYKTSDGSFIRQGRLTNCFYLHKQFGRNLLYATEQTLRSVVLWDPMTDKVLFEAAQLATLAGGSERDPEFPVADTAGKVRVIDGMTGRVKLQFQLNPLDFQPPQQPPALKSFSDGTRHYLNVHRQTQVMSHTTYASDALFPTQQITGDLHAIDPTTSQVLWTRTKISPQNIVHQPDYRLPFLVALSRWRGPRPGNSQSSLRVEVIDGETGRTLALKINGFNDRLLVSDYDRNAGRLRYRGAVTQFQLEFGPNLNRPIPNGDEFVLGRALRDVKHRQQSVRSLGMESE